ESYLHHGLLAIPAYPAASPRAFSLRTASAHRSPRGVVSEGHLPRRRRRCRRRYRVHQVRFDEEAVARVNDVIIHREPVVGIVADGECVALFDIFESAREKTVGDRGIEDAAEALVWQTRETRVNTAICKTRQGLSCRVRIQLGGAVVLATVDLLCEAKPVVAAECRSRSRLRVSYSRANPWIVDRGLGISGREHQRRVPVAGEIEKECGLISVFWRGVEGDGGRAGATGSGGVDGIGSSEGGADLGARLWNGDGSLDAVEQQKSVRESIGQVAAAIGGEQADRS